MINENIFEMFMNDVMEEKCLQVYEIIPKFKQKVAKIQKFKWTMKENIRKLHVQKTIWKLHSSNSLCWAFLCA